MDTKHIPILWINLERATKRRARMNWAINKGGWKAYRTRAIDGDDIHQMLLAIPNLLDAGTPLPGLYRNEEVQPRRLTSRAELACLASWKQLLIKAKGIQTQSDWLLLMEDDLGASLATPEDWEHSMINLIESCPTETLAIQLAPISATVRKELAEQWYRSHGKCLAIKKEYVRSHGNGAVLLHKRALDLLLDPLLLLTNKLNKNLHLLLHPWRIRPVADKWIYGSLPPGSCQVATYPHFCLEAEDSSLHLEHVVAFHKPSREITMEIWNNDQHRGLIEAQKNWDDITIES